MWESSLKRVRAALALSALASLSALTLAALVLLPVPTKADAVSDYRRAVDARFGQWLQEGIARYTPLVVSRSEEITPTENEISLECVEDKLTPHINGIQIRTRQEKLHVLTEGKVGVSAASFGSAPLGVSYDWIRVGIP